MQLKNAGELILYELRAYIFAYAIIMFSHDAVHIDLCTFPFLKIVRVEFQLKGWFLYLSRVMRKPTFCICKNKDADQLRGSREADHRLCFRYTDSTIYLLSKS